MEIYQNVLTYYNANAYISFWNFDQFIWERVIALDLEFFIKSFL
jgi:hypothetical protein